jgi:MiaB-like tRNA modifying enzyme
MDAVQYSDELKIELPRIRANSVIGIVPISSGCLSQCTFCSVKQIKGNLKSYPLLSIIHDINIAINNGCKEIWLTSQDNGCYGFDINTNLAELLGYVIKIDGEFMVRIGMASPQHLINYLDELIHVLKSEKIFKFIHLPVQSGNEQILKKMRREYDVSTFKAVIKNIRDAIPKLTLSTDVICGFPTETEEQFDDTLRLIVDITPDIVNISRYQARPYTLSAKMPQLSGEELKNRTRKLTKLFNVVALQQNRKWIDWQGRIIIDEVGKNNTFIGRNYAYKPVVVCGEFKLGEIVHVKINDMTSYDLRGEVVNSDKL